MTNKMKTDITLLSTQRSFIMGIAILWVAWFHTDLPVGIPGLSFLRETGYGGVDLFFLMSGIGAYYSLTKNPDTVSYIKNRAKRILPSYYPFIILWIIMMKLTAEIYGIEIIGNLTMMGWWCESRCQFNWYTNAIWLFYLLAPFVVGWILKEEYGKKRIRSTLLLMAAGFLTSMTFWHTLLLTAFSRLPLFVLGVYLGSEMLDQSVWGREAGTSDMPGELLQNRRYVWQKHSLLFWNILMAAGCFSLYICLTKFTDYMWPYGLWWYPFVLIAPGLAMDLGLLAGCLQQYRLGNAIRSGVNTVGEASFEIFLWHIGIFEFVKPRVAMNGVKWTALFILVVLWGILYRRLIQRIFRV